MIVGSGANAATSGSTFEEKLKHAFLNSTSVQSCFGKLHKDMSLVLNISSAQGIMTQFKRVVLQDPDFQSQVLDKIARRFEANQVCHP